MIYAMDMHSIECGLYYLQEDGCDVCRIVCAKVEIMRPHHLQGSSHDHANNHDH